MAESAGRYCPLCGEAVGLKDRFCRRCLQVLTAPAPGEDPERGRQERRQTREEANRLREELAAERGRGFFRRLFGVKSEDRRPDVRCER